jgi:hypothetical protein
MAVPGTKLAVHRDAMELPLPSAYIDVGGQAMPCDGVAPVWNGEAYDAFRARLASDDPPSPCKACALYR